jgi:hypothetical protein
MIAPLHIAAVNGFADVIEILLASGANIEAKDSNDRTPIIYAASKKENFAAVQVCFFFFFFSFLFRSFFRSFFFFFFPENPFFH